MSLSVSTESRPALPETRRSPLAAASVDGPAVPGVAPRPRARSYSGPGCRGATVTRTRSVDDLDRDTNTGVGWRRRRRAFEFNLKTRKGSWPRPGGPGRRRPGLGASLSEDEGCTVTAARHWHSGTQARKRQEPGRPTRRLVELDSE
jgi:hypothetical protein